MLALLLACARPGPTTPADRAAWRVPDCTLTYGVQGLLDLDVAEAPGMAQGISMTLEFTLAPDPDDPGRLMLSQGPMTVAQRKGMLTMPGSTADGGILAPVLLRAGPTLQEEDGPTKMWAAFDSFEGLHLLFPPLAQTDWHRRAYSKTDAWPVEVRRGQSEAPDGAVLSEPGDGSVIAGTVERTGRGVIEGERADTLTGQWQWSQRSETIEDFATTVDATGSGQWWVRDGVLLAARIEESRSIDLSVTAPGQERTMHQTHTARLEARLLTGCDGAVLPAIPAATSPVQQGITRWTAVRDVLTGGEGELEALIAAAFAPAVLKAHPAADIAAHLREYAATNTWHALGHTELPPDPPQTVDGAVWLSFTGQGPHRETLAVVLSVEEDSGLLRWVKVDRIQGLPEPEGALLEVSAEALR